MEVLYHLRHHETIYCGDIPLPSPYIGLIYRRYLHPSINSDSALADSAKPGRRRRSFGSAGGGKLEGAGRVAFGLLHMNLSFFPFIGLYWEEQFQLTHMFQRGGTTTKQNVSHFCDREAKPKNPWQFSLQATSLKEQHGFAPGGTGSSRTPGRLKQPRFFAGWSQEAQSDQW